MNNGRIIVQVDKVQKSFEDRGYYSSISCDLIENMILCNKTKLSEHGGSGRIRFTDNSGMLKVQLSVIKGNSFMTDESKAVVVIRSQGDSIRSNAYYGGESELDFVSYSESYLTNGVENHIESLKNFYKSWQVKKGEICAVVVIVEDKVIFDSLVKDTFFDNCYVLLAE